MQKPRLQLPAEAHRPTLLELHDSAFYRSFYRVSIVESCRTENDMDGYVERHILPAVGKIRLRRLRHRHLEALYSQMLTPTADQPGLSPKTVYEVHLVIAAPSATPCAAVSSVATSPWSPMHQGCGQS